MLILTQSGTDKLQLTTSASVSIDVHASWVDLVTGVATPGRTNTNLPTAGTNDIVATPAAGVRNVKMLSVRNKDASVSCDVTVVFDQNGTDYELYKSTLAPGATLEFVEGVGFFVVQNVAKLDAKLRVAGDVINATTSFADVTGLTCPVENGKHYNFEAHLFHIGNATTTGAQFGINGPTMTNMRISEIDVVLGSLTAATMGANTTDVTTRDVASIAETTGAATVVLAILSGWINPSAAGTFAVRCASEVAVAAGLTVKAGSWCRIWES